ncbi:FadR family transcriptional regulator [Aeromicrobium camelliae]|uniref:FadR family transcriptional regulator n=1 Tax=Aeromicrobium camelliae TaxID=1538144 RepID=A0A3N6WKV7_9ACTN|nr:GntR family transcriptional regulator [Aeromicrobium camelliae]RQN08206.1 FadR family transcriptional regulator [Aeromicrobium camelliae]
MQSDDLLSTLTRRVLFAPLADQGRADAVAERLRIAISLGILGEGEQLPPEPDLAAQFNVSHVTLREALTQLRAQGMVTTRRGRGGGTVVSAPRPNQLRVALEQVARFSRLDLRDLADWRRAIACEAASLAVARASTEDVALLARGTIRLAAAGDEVESRRADSRFFIELAAASQSVRLSRAMINLQVEYAPVLTLVYTDQQLRAEVAQILQDLMIAVREADGDAARRHATAAIDRVAVRATVMRSEGWPVP